MTTSILVIISVLVLAAIAIGLIVNKLVHVCHPNEVLIFSGTKRSVSGRNVGYKLVQGGRGVRLPMLERVHRLDLTNMIVELRVESAYSRGGIPLNVSGVANVKIASSEPTIGNAIERFLGKSRGQIMAIAKETLEGNLRGVLATLTPEEVNDDRVKFAASLLHEADNDLKRLGLMLDTLKIQHVSDDKGYLDSIGRKQAAQLMMRSRVAEAENRALADVRAAENMQKQEVARLDAQMKIAHAVAQGRIVVAKTRGEAMIQEQRGEVLALIARAEGEREVQIQNIERVRLQLEADRIKLAEAQREALVDKARGKAARVIEDGKAQARALRALAKAWSAAGDDAARIFVAQKMKSMVRRMLTEVEHAPVNKLTVIDGRLSAGGSSNLPTKALVASEQLKETLGVDVPSLLARLSPPASEPAV
jgi:flotillin